MRCYITYLTALRGPSPSSAGLCKGDTRSLGAIDAPHSMQHLILYTVYERCLPYPMQSARPAFKFPFYQPPVTFQTKPLESYGDA